MRTILSCAVAAMGPIAPSALGAVVVEGLEQSSIAANLPGMTGGCIASLNDGRLFAVWSTAGASIAGSYSQDFGQSWSAPQSLIDTGTGCDYDPSIIVSGQRVIVTSTERTGGAAISTSVTNAVLSDNSGQTWGSVYQIPMNHRYTSGKVGPGLRLQSGALLMPYSWDAVLETPGTTVNSESAMDPIAGTMISTNNGATWVNHGSVNASYTRVNPAGGLGGSTDEPKIVQLQDGSLYMLARTSAANLYQARSTDNGATWTDVGPTSWTSSNAPAGLCTFQMDGKQGMLAMWDNSDTARYPLLAATSFDEGLTWSAPTDIAGDTGGYQASYPNIVQAADGTMVAVWQQQTATGWDVRSARFTLTEAPEPSGMALLFSMMLALLANVWWKRSY
jgi:hypothetical protein